jgi:CRP-like cAMP-binding protein
MVKASQAPAQALIVKLESITQLSKKEKQALLDLQMRVQDIRADQDLVREGDRPSQCCLIVEGFACRYKFTDTGKRQIFAFHTPGDVPDLQSLHLRTMDHSLGTLTPSTVAFVPREALLALTRQHPRLSDILWRDTLIDAAIFREWMLGIGRRSAKTRIAHLFCEMFCRLKAVGLEKNGTVPLPLTQNEVGDALGLSTVHINRTLQDLRAEKLVEWERDVLTVLDWERLKQTGEFDPLYLHQDQEWAA